MRRALVVVAMLSTACSRGGDVLGNLTEPKEIVADASSVYVADGDQLVRWADGTRTSLFHGMRVDNIAVDDDAIYYVTYDATKAEAAIHRLAKRGGAAIVLATDWPLEDVQSDGDHVYWQSGAIHRVPTSGGPVETIVPSEAVDPGSDLAIDGNYVYFVGRGSIDRVPVRGAPVDVLATGVTDAEKLTVHDGIAWWTEQHATVLHRVAPGGRVQTIALDRGAFVAGLAWSDGMLVLDSAGKKLVRVDAAGEVTPVKTFDAYPSTLATYGAAIYVAFDRHDHTAASIRRF